MSQKIVFRLTLLVAKPLWKFLHMYTQVHGGPENTCNTVLRSSPTANDCRPDSLLLGLKQKFLIDRNCCNDDMLLF